MAVPALASQEIAEPVEPRAGVLRNVFSSLMSNRKALAGLAVLLLFTVVSIFAPVLAPYDPHSLQFDALLPPSIQHLLCTAANGQDIFSQLVWSNLSPLLLAMVALIVGCAEC